MIGGETSGGMGAESGRCHAKRRRRLRAAIQHSGMGRSTIREIKISVLPFLQILFVSDLQEV